MNYLQYLDKRGDILPTEVWTASDLDDVRSNLSGNYIQMADIDLSTWGNWTPIGSWASGFIGTYDGNNFKIENLYSHHLSWDVGLFATITSGGVVKNVILEDLDIDGMGQVGGIAGTTRAIGSTTPHGIENCRVIGHSSINCYDWGDVGGIVGGCFGTRTVTIKNNYVGSNCVITSPVGQNVGGIAGYYEGDIFEKNVFLGEVSGSIAVGGLIGATRDCLIENSYAKGNVLGEQSVGGIAGNLSQTLAQITTIKDCYFAGYVHTDRTTNNVFCGGIFGNFSGITSREEGPQIINCYYNQELVSNNASGTAGFPRRTCEMVYSNYLKDSREIRYERINEIPVGWTGIYTAGDLINIGSNLSGDYILMTDIDITVYFGASSWNPIGDAGDPFTGNFNGNLYTIRGPIINSSRSGRQGLFGYVDYAEIKNLYLSHAHIEDTNSDWGSYHGILAGQTNDSIIENCHVHGYIKVGNHGGGLAGFATNSDFINCTFNVEVEGNSYLSGMVGEASICNFNYCGGQVILRGLDLVDYDDAQQLGGFLSSGLDIHCNNCYVVGELVGAWGGTSILTYKSAGFAVLDEDSELTNCYSAIIFNNDNLNISEWDEDTAYFVHSLTVIPSGNISNCYYDQDIANLPVGADSTYGIPKTTSEMKTQSTFSTWSFSEVWDIGDYFVEYSTGNINEGYPFLHWDGRSTYTDWDFDEIWNHDVGHTINNGYPMFEKIVILVSKCVPFLFKVPKWV